MNQVPSPIDIAALLEMLGGEGGIVASLLSKFVEELTSDLAATVGLALHTHTFGTR